jgi:hypothetical protein
MSLEEFEEHFGDHDDGLNQSRQSITEDTLRAINIKQTLEIEQ